MSDTGGPGAIAPGREPVVHSASYVRATSMMNVLLLGASGPIGSHLIAALDRDDQGISVTLADDNLQHRAQWRAQGRNVRHVDPNDPASLRDALRGINRLFFAMPPSVDMLAQGKALVDAAFRAGVSHMVSLGVFDIRQSPVPHFAWHRLIETYVESSGIPWTHLHPNMVMDTALAPAATIMARREIQFCWGDAPAGWVAASDVAAVAAAILREGPRKHHKAHYWFSTEVADGREIAAILGEVLGIDILYRPGSASGLARRADDADLARDGAYLVSVVKQMNQMADGRLAYAAIVRDDVTTVLGRPGLNLRQWALQHRPPPRDGAASGKASTAAFLPAC